MRLKTVAFLPARGKQHLILTRCRSHYWNVFRTWSVTCVYQFYCKNIKKKKILQPHTYKTKINTKKQTTHCESSGHRINNGHSPHSCDTTSSTNFANCFFFFFIQLYINLSILLPPFKNILRLVHWAVEVKSQMTSDDSRISLDITGMCVLVFSIVKHLCSCFFFFAAGLCDVRCDKIWNHYCLISF